MSSTIVTSTESSPATPLGMIAIGHSGLTGENSNPDRPGQDALENSWATGTNPEVDSVYQRLVTVLPATDGHVANTAQGGASASSLVTQASAALEVVPTPALVIIQTIDNDIRCDGTDPEHIDEFGSAVAASVDLLVTASPNSRILMVGQLGRPSPAFVEELVDEDPSVQAFVTGTGPCDFYDSNGNLLEANFETLTRIIESYEAEQARVCAAVPQCRTDDGARAAYVDELNNFSSDWAHLSVRGNAQAAEIIWPRVAALLELGQPTTLTFRSAPTSTSTAGVASTLP